MLCVMFEHGVTYVRVGCVDDVITTRNGRGQNGRVYMADTARQDIWGARGDSETSDGVVCSSGRRKELKLTC